MSLAGIPVNGLAAAGIWVVAISFLGIFVRQIVPWKKVIAESDVLFRRDLLSRIEKLERMLERERSRHNAERALDRHRLNNVTQCFDALLLLIETAPDKATEIVAKIKTMRAEQLRAEAQEKAIIRAAEIEADTELEIEMRGIENAPEPKPSPGQARRSA
jgi:hypothetical protein